MKAGIITTPDRQKFLPKMVELIAPFVDTLRIYNDERKQGQPYNLSRAMKDLLPSAQHGEPILICTDDVETVKDWKARFERIHFEACGEIYVMFNRKRHLFKDENLKKSWVKGVFPGAFYDQATIYINQQDLPAKIDNWLANGGREKMGKKINHFDEVIQEYLVHSGKEWVVTTPSLFEHVGAEDSVLSHKIGKSVSYIGNL